MEERIMIFIDGSNFYHGLREMGRRIGEIPTLYFDKLGRILSRNRKLIRIYYYTALHNEQDEIFRYQKQKKFLDHLRGTSYCAVRYGHLMRREGAFIEKGVDVLLTVDLLRLARLNSYDTAILISGDGDFVEAVKDVQDMGRHVELAYFPFAQSQDLRRTCDRYTEITETMLSMAATRTMPEMILVPRVAVRK